MANERYLMIVEKPAIARMLVSAFGKIEHQVPYALDVVVANNHVMDINNAIYREFNKSHDLEKLKVVELKGRKVQDNFRVFQNGHYQKFGRLISALVRNKTYDAIINACDKDEEGEYTFQYTIESLGLDEYPVKCFFTMDFREEALIKDLEKL